VTVLYGRGGMIGFWLRAVYADADKASFSSLNMLIVIVLPFIVDKMIAIIGFLSRVPDVPNLVWHH